MGPCGYYVTQNAGLDQSRPDPGEQFLSTLSSSRMCTGGPPLTITIGTGTSVTKQRVMTNFMLH